MDEVWSAAVELLRVCCVWDAADGILRGGKEGETAEDGADCRPEQSEIGHPETVFPPSADDPVRAVSRASNHGATGGEDAC